MHRSRRWRPLVDYVLKGRPLVAAAFASHPILFRPLLSDYLDARIPTRDRYLNFAHDLAFTAHRLQRSFPGFFPTRLEQTLWTDSGLHYALVLALNVRDPQEGLWRLSLRDGGGATVFHASFAILPGGRLFIGAVQGANHGAMGDAPAAVRAATKHFDGLRPPFLLLHGLRRIAAVWGIGAMIGVSTRNQLTACAGRDKRAAVRFSYDRYFLEAGAQPSPCGNWALPTAPLAKPLADVPSRKRAMYRRRLLLLRHLDERIGSLLADGDLDCAPGSNAREFCAEHTPIPF